MYGEDVFKLTKDRPQVTPEIHCPNDFYGNASMLKLYAGLPQNYPLKLVVEHGPMFPGCHWHVDLNSPLPVFLTSSEAARGMLQKSYPAKKFFALGPHIAYAPLSHSPDTVGKIKEKLGKNLLVALPHSSHHIAVNYSSDSVMHKVQQMGKEFDSITISIYWKDCSEQLISACEKYGFLYVTAGHIYDLRFLSRLNTILHCSDAVVSFGFTSMFPYACYLKKPVVLLKVEDLYLTNCGDERVFLESVDEKTPNEKASDSVVEKLYREFDNFRDVPSPVGYELLNLWAGFDQVKTPGEILQLCLEAEEAFSSIPLRFLHPVSR